MTNSQISELVVRANEAGFRKTKIYEWIPPKKKRGLGKFRQFSELAGVVEVSTEPPRIFGL